MIRLLATAFAVFLFVVPLRTAPMPAIAGAGFLGVLLTLLAIGARWRWPATAAACVFLADYAAALWIVRGPVNVVGAAGFGLALLLLLQTVDLACRVRGTTVDATLVLSELGRWIGLGAAALVAVVLAVALANSLATTVPAVVSPLLAAAGALGAVLILAVVSVRAGKMRQSMADDLAGSGERGADSGKDLDWPPRQTHHVGTGVVT